MSQQGPHGALTAEEIKNICRTQAGRVLINAVNNITYQKQFEVNDTLIVKCCNYRTKVLETVMESGDTPEKYMVVHKDEAGLIYVKRILKGGKLGQKVDMIATWDYDTYRFEPDPERMESILMDQEEGYDPYAKAKELKKKQDKQRRLNKAMRIRFDTFKEAEMYMRTKLSVGQKFYLTSCLTDNDVEEREILSISYEPLQAPTRNLWSSDPYDPDVEYKKEGFTDKCVVKFKTGSRTYQDTLSKSHFTGNWYNFYESKPYTQDNV